MDLQIELYTTPTVEGRKILSSKGFVCANIVLGAGVIDEDYQMIQKFLKIETSKRKSLSDKFSINTF